MLLAALNARRPTRDVDVQAVGVPIDADALTVTVTEVLTGSVDDGLVFDNETLMASPIRAEAVYPGVRLSAATRLHTARPRPKRDIGTGDPISPPPATVAIPSLRDDPPVHMHGFPLAMAMVIAEKIVTAVERGDVNTRWRDFGDGYLLTRQHAIDGQQLRETIHVVAGLRGTQLRPRATVLDGFAALGQPSWQAWLRRQELAELLPQDFSATLAALIDLVDPVIMGQITDVHTWSPGATGWSRAPSTT